MYGAVWFPTVSPDLSWLARAVLYWPTIAVVLPDAGTPEIDEFMQAATPLFQSKLAVRAYPRDAHLNLTPALESYLDLLDPGELARRQDRFRAGSVTRLYQERFIYSLVPTNAYDLGLASIDPNSDVVTLERDTSLECLSAVALGMCHYSSNWWRETVRRGGIDGWVPISATEDSFRAVTAPSPTRSDGPTPSMRIGTSMTAALVRFAGPVRALPVPRAMTVENAVAFRARHGEVLIDLREEFMRRLDAAAGALTDADLAELHRGLGAQVERAEAALRSDGWDELTTMVSATATKAGTFRDEPLVQLFADPSELAADTHPTAAGPSLALLIEDALGTDRGYEYDDNATEPDDDDGPDGWSQEDDDAEDARYRDPNSADKMV